MDYFDKFKRKMDLSGGSLKNENIINSRLLLKETFKNDASFTSHIHLWNSGVNPHKEIDSIGIRMYERRFSSANGVTCKFQTQINNPIIVGDILYNSRTKEYFICTESFNINEIHWQGKLTLCNWILKWQNKNGDILEYPCYDINSTQYNSGEQSNKQFTIGSSQHMITLPCDENTIALSSPQRFFLDKNKVQPTSFIITQNDNTSYNFGKKGIVKITLYEYPKNSETDRPDLGICDYIEQKKKNDYIDNIEKSIIHYKTKVIKSGGDAQTFTGEFYDNQGQKITHIIPKWKIICDFKNYLEVEQCQNQISIKIDNDNFVDEDFKLILSDENGNFPSELIVGIESLL